MSIALALSEVLTHALPADIIPNPPATPPPGDAAAQGTTLLGYAKYVVLFLAGVGAIVSVGLVAAGSTSSRPHLRERGQTGLIACVGAVILVGLVIPFLNTLAG